MSIGKNENEKSRKGSAIIGGKEVKITQEGSTTGSSEIIDDFNYYSAGGVNDIATKGNYTYIVNEGGLSVLDINSPITSTIIASLPLINPRIIKISEIGRASCRERV